MVPARHEPTVASIDGSDQRDRSIRRARRRGLRARALGRGEATWTECHFCPYMDSVFGNSSRPPRPVIVQLASL